MMLLHNQYDRLAFTIFFFVLAIHTHYTRTQNVHTHTRMQKTPQIHAIDFKQSICTTPIALMFNTFETLFLLLLLLDAFYVRDALEIYQIVLSIKEIDRHRSYWIVIVIY